MKQNERALWALEVAGEIDPAIIAEDEALRAKPRRWRIAVIAAALLCAGAIGTGVALLRRDSGDAPPVETTGPTEPEPPASGEIHDGGWEAMRTTSHIRWAGMTYHEIDYTGTITPDLELGTVAYNYGNELSYAGFRANYDPYWTVAPFLPVGTKVYSVKGYSSAWRICAYDERGKLLLFSSSHAPNLGNDIAPLAHVFPAPEQVERMVLWVTNFGMIGEIDDPEVIANLVGRLREHGRFINEKLYNQQLYDTDQPFRLEIHLTDGTKTYLNIQNHAVATWLDQIDLPDGFTRDVRKHILYPVSQGWAWPDGYGWRPDNTSYGTDENQSHHCMGEYRETHASFTVRREGTTLWLSDMFQGDDMIAIADDAAGDIRIEGLDIFYRTVKGQIARIRFDCPGARIIFREEVKRGVDLSTFITEREIVDEGPYVRLQTRAGQFFTLDAEANLALNGEIIAQNVLHYSLDAWGVVYDTPDGLYRRLTADGQVITLCTDKLIQYGRFGLYIHYLTEDGRLGRVRCDGERAETVAMLDGAVKYIHDAYLGSDEREAWLVLDAGGTVRLIVEGISYFVADEVEDIRIDQFGGYALVYRNGHIEECIFGYRQGYVFEGMGQRLRGGVEIS